ncbi:DUF6326 family protein [Candidatus Bipolaricaulota bacterium]
MKKELGIRGKLSTLWIVVMMNMIFADILGFAMTLMSGDLTPEAVVADWGMLIFAMILQVPIFMILLSRILKRSVNRWANIIAAVITTAFVVLGASFNIVYYFFAAVEIVCMALIVFYAWTWPQRDGTDLAP